jgi:uncharacterized Fe-S cluster protein YjdI
MNESDFDEVNLKELEAPPKDVEETSTHATGDEVKAPETVKKVVANEAPVTGMRKHPLNWMRVMNTEEHDALKKSMEKNYDGEHFPITVASDGTLDSDGKKVYELIIDGYNSWLITQELGIAPVFRHFDGTEEEILDFIFKSNTRRNLSPSDAAFVVIDYEMKHSELEVEAKTRMSEGGKNKGSHKNDQHKETGRTDDKVANKLGIKTNRNLTAQARKAVKEDPELLEKIKKGEISPEDAIRAEKTKALIEKSKNIPIGPEASVKKAPDKLPAILPPKIITLEELAIIVRGFKAEMAVINADEDSHKTTKKSAISYDAQRTKLLCRMAKTLFVENEF